MPEAGSTLGRPTRVITVPPKPDSVREVRTLVRSTLETAGVADETVDTALLLVSELVTNAVLHAHTAVDVRVSLTTAVRVDVHDDSKQLPFLRTHHAESVAGRGLEIVELLATDFGVEPSEDAGKTVWFTLIGPQQERSGSTVSRHEAPDEPGADLTVRLRGLPLLLYEVMREHSEALLRELALHRLDHGDRAPGPSLVTISAADAARTRISEAVEAARASAIGGYLDVDVTVGPRDIAALTQLQPVFREAEELARAGHILTPPALPELRELRSWCLDQFERQFSGHPPTRWRTPEPGEARTEEMSADIREAAAQVRASPEALVLARGDDRIVAASPAAAQLVGWEPDELIGMRIVVLVPPRLRDLHVAGFTRHLVTGRRLWLGVTMDVTAWHRTGREIPISLTLDVWPGVRSLYLARFGQPGSGRDYRDGPPGL